MSLQFRHVPDVCAPRLLNIYHEHPRDSRPQKWKSVRIELSLYTVATRNVALNGVSRYARVLIDRLKVLLVEVLVWPLTPNLLTRLDFFSILILKLFQISLVSF